jgi:hypothetical protein
MQAGKEVKKNAPHGCSPKVSGNVGNDEVFLPGEWIFAADPTDQGTRERWFAGERYYAAAARLTVGGTAEQEAALGQGLARMHINRGVGWEQHGFPGLDGYGWDFQNLEVPQELAGKKHL